MASSILSRDRIKYTDYLGSSQQGKNCFLNQPVLYKPCKNLKIHLEDVEFYQSDLSNIWIKWTVLSKVLPKTTIKDLTIDYCDVAKIVYNHAWFSWLQDVPVDMKVRFKNLKVLYFDLNFDEPMPMCLFKQVYFLFERFISLFSH